MNSTCLKEYLDNACVELVRRCAVKCLNRDKYLYKHLMKRSYHTETLERVGPLYMPDRMCKIAACTHISR